MTAVTLISWKVTLCDYHHLIIEISCPFQKINHKKHKPVTVLIVCAENGHSWLGEVEKDRFDKYF